MKIKKQINYLNWNPGNYPLLIWWWKRVGNMAEEYDGETTFSPTNSLKEQLNGEQSSQNNFWSLAADIRRPEKQPIVFEGR